jgi:carnitine-CoA ligase
VTATSESSMIEWPEGFPRAWSSVRKTTINGFLVRCFAQADDGPAIVFDDGLELRFSELQDRIERFGGYLTRRIEPGDRVAIAIGNRAEYLIAYFGIVAARGVVVPMSPAIGPQDSAHMVNNARCILAFADGEAGDVLESIEAPDLREVVRLTADEPDGLAGRYGDDARLALSDVRADPTDLVDIHFTSGTTGLPKALPGDHLSLLRYVDSVVRSQGVSSDGRILVPLQFHYVDAVFLSMASWYVGAAAVIMRRFSVSRFWDVARTYGATTIYTIGSIPNLLLTAPPGPRDRAHKIRFAIATGVPRRQHKELNERFGFPWYDYYGSSEAGPVTGTPRELAEQFVGTGAIGIPYPELEVRLVNPDGFTICGAGEGELEVRGEILFHGYLNNPEATESVLHDDYYQTGDLMRRDERGMYYFLGRSKELIRRGGENISPAEVEATLRLHDEVIDAAVVPAYDDIRGEEVMAHVHVDTDRGDLAPELARFCAERLAAFKVPRYIKVRCDPFPRTPSQRIQKERLKVDGRHDPSGAWDRQA